MDTHPDPQPNPHHRKIDLQSSHDLTYLQTNLANSALQKLDLHFPKISKPATHISLDPQPKNPTIITTAKLPFEDDDDDDDDPMRRRVQDLIHTFLLQTWTSASHNITVNGNDASTLPVPSTATLAPSVAIAAPSSSTQTPPLEVEGIHYQHAPFDASLQHKLASLHGELESLTAQVSRLRRTAPATGAELQQESLRAVLEADDARHDAEMQLNLESETHGLDIQPVDRDGWNEDVRDMYEVGLRELAALAGVGYTQHGDGNGGEAPERPSLTETVGKAQRAVRVAMELE